MIKQALTFAAFCLVMAWGAQAYLIPHLQLTASGQNQSKQKAQKQTASYSSQSSQSYPIGANGHVNLSADVNNREMEFLVDTGASFVALRESDARRAGYSFSASDYTATVSTANGQTKVAPFIIDEIELDDIRVRNVQAAAIPDDALSKNLLGMSFLGQLKRFEFTNGQLVLED